MLLMVSVAQQDVRRMKTERRVGVSAVGLLDHGSSVSFVCVSPVFTVN